MNALLPHITAFLNGLAGLLALTGYVLVKKRRLFAHRIVMSAAVATSALFLVAYLLHHVTAPVFVFRGEGIIRPIYFTMLISHVFLAVLVTPMVAVAFMRARSARFAQHRALAQWTLPIWLYVSATGIAVYVLVYHVYRGP